MATQAKKITIPLVFKVNDEELKQQSKIIKELIDLSAQDTRVISETDREKLKDIQSQLRVLQSQLDQISAKELFNDKSFSLANKSILEVQKKISSLSNSIIKSFVGKDDIFDSKEIKDYQKELEKTENRISEINKELGVLGKKQERFQNEGLLDIVKESAKKEGSKSSRYIGKGSPLGDLKSLQDSEQALKIIETQLVSIYRNLARVKELQKEKPTQKNAAVIADLQKQANVWNSIAQGIDSSQNEQTEYYDNIWKLAEEVKKLTEEQERLNNAIKETKRIASEDPSINEQTDRLNDLESNAESFSQKNITAKTQDEINKQQTNIDNLGKSIKGFTDNVNKSSFAWDGFIGKFISSQIIFNGMKRIFRETVSTIKELDAAFNGIAIVTGKTTKEVWNMYDSFQEIAKVTGFTVKEISDVALKYFQQGKSFSEVIKLTEAAASAAKIAGISAADSVTYLTSAVNGYRMSAEQAMEVSDKFATLAAVSATDYDGLATALSKVAAQAYTVGVEMDSMMGYIAKVLETTQEAPENIGTAFKTIFARMSEITDFGATLEDGVSINAVDTALQSVGVKLKDTSGEVRDLDEVLDDLGKQWINLSKNQKTYIATAVAGTRQQSRFLALMEDYDRTIELVESSSNSLGATYAQQATYTESLAFAQNKLNVAWENFITSFSNSEIIISFFNLATNTLEGINTLIEGFNFEKWEEGKTSIRDFVSVFSLLGITATGLFAKGSKSVISFVDNISELNKEGKDVSVFSNILADFFNKTLKLEKTNLQAALSASVFTGETTTLTTGFKELIKTIGFGNSAIGGAMLVFMAFATVAGFVAANMKTQEEKMAEANEEIKRMQAEIYNLNASKKEIKSLAEEFLNLNDKIIKSEEDLQEMDSILSKLGDQGIKIDLDEFTSIGMEYIEEQIEKNINGKMIKAYEDMREQLDLVYSSNNNLSESYKNSETAMQNALVANEALKASNVENIAAYYELSTAERNFYENIANTGLISGALDNYSKLSEELENLKNKKDLLEKEGWGTSTIDAQIIAKEKEMETEFSYSNAAQLENVWNNLNEKTNIYDQTLSQAVNTNETLNQVVLTFGENAQDAANKYKDSMSPALNSIERLIELLGSENINFVNLDLKELTEIESELKGLGLQGNILKNVFKDIVLQPNLQASAQKIADNFKALGLNAEQALSVIHKLNDLRFDDTIGNIKTLTSSLNSVGGNIDAFKEATENGWDMTAIYELTSLYPELWEVLADGVITNEELASSFDTITEAERAKVEAAYQARQDQIAIEKAELVAKREWLANMLYLYATGNESQKKQVVKGLKEELGLNIEGWNADLKNYEQYLNEKSAMLIEAEKWESDWRHKLTNKPFEYSLDDYIANAYEDPFKGDNNDGEDKNEKIKSEIDAQIEAINKQIEALDNESAALEHAKTKSIQFAKAGTEEAKKYAAQLNALFNIQQKLDANASELDLLETMAENTELSGEELGKIYKRQMELYEDNAKLYSEKADIIKEEAEDLKIKLSNLGNYVDFTEGGDVLVNLEKYETASEDIQEQVDELVESYKDLTDEYRENKKASIENANAQRELRKKLEDNEKETRKAMYDAKVDYENMFLEVYKANLEKQHNEDLKDLEDKKELLEKKFDEEKEYLEKRKKMYEDFFEDQDNENELQEMDTQRQSIVDQLSALEGATDNNSLKKRQELLKELNDLNKSYNEKMTEINRDAVLDEIDKELDEKEKAKEKEVKSYEEQIKEMEDGWEEFINNNAALWEELQGMIGESWEERKTWLKEHSIDFENATENQKEQMRILWEETRQETEDTKEEWEKAKETLDVFNGVLDESIEKAEEIKEETETIADNASDAKDEANKFNTTLNNAIAPLDTNVSKSSSLATNMRNAADAAQDYADALKDQNDEKERALLIPNDTRVENMTSYIPTVDRTIATGKATPMATGGSTQVTGWHWLDGKVGKPERVLSAQQTEAFDKLVDHITNNNIGSLNSAINIGNIAIETSELNTTQDFVTAGRALAEALNEAISNRGININQRR